MRPLYGEPCLRRTTTSRAIHMLDRMLSVNGARRAADLPEEARVRLYRRLSAFLDAEREAEWERRLNPGLLPRVRLWLTEARELCRQALLS